jgi:hypothetical protein
MGMPRLLSMVVCQIDIECVAILEAEDNPPIGAHADGPKPLKVSAKRMEPQAWKIHVLNLFRGFEQTEDVLDFLDVPRVDAPAVVIFVEPLQAFMAKPGDHERLLALCNM